tara:strand:- start:27624 stop:27845 length:222 start_codon:yes stop_codon:yes gene_type:complete
MNKYCPKCKCSPIVLKEKQERCIHFYVNLNGNVSDKGEIQETPLTGVVFAVCCNCDTEWKIDGITQACQYASL